MTLEKVTAELQEVDRRLEVMTTAGEHRVVLLGLRWSSGGNWLESNEPERVGSSWSAPEKTTLLVLFWRAAATVEAIGSWRRVLRSCR